MGLLVGSGVTGASVDGDDVAGAPLVGPSVGVPLGKSVGIVEGARVVGAGVSSPQQATARNSDISSGGCVHDVWL